MIHAAKRVGNHTGRQMSDSRKRRNRFFARSSREVDADAGLRKRIQRLEKHLIYLPDGDGTIRMKETGL